MKSSQTSSETRILSTLIDYFRQESFVFFAIKESRMSIVKTKQQNVMEYGGGYSQNGRFR